MSLRVQNSLPKLKCNTLWSQSGFSSMDTSPSTSGATSSIASHGFLGGTPNKESTQRNSTKRSSIASYGFLGGSTNKESTQRMEVENFDNSHSSSTSLDDPMKEVDDEDVPIVIGLEKQFTEEEESLSDAEQNADDNIILDQNKSIKMTEDDETASLHDSSDSAGAGPEDTQPEKVEDAEHTETNSEKVKHVMNGSSTETENGHGVSFSTIERQAIFNVISPTNTSILDSEQLIIRKSFSDGIIDNSTLEYVPIRLQCGVNVMCAPQVLSNSPLVLRCLQTDAQRLFTILPRSLHDLLRRTKIWVNASYSYGSFDYPQILRHSTTHHSEDWLVKIAKDMPEKACGIEIYDCQYYEQMRLHWNGAGLLLHEFCHLVHQFCLGLDNTKVLELYHKADSSGKYNQTPRRDWAGCEKTHDLAYALVDQKEFFSEMSVTYLSNGYQHLNKGDCSMLETCSPPLLKTDVFKRVLRQHDIEDPLERPEDSLCYIFDYAKRRHPKPKLEIADPIFRERALATNCRNIPICNKFYPFTRGQLKHHDPSLCDAMGDLWREIARWKDPEAESNGLCSFLF